MFVSFRVFRGEEVQRLKFRSLGIHLSTKEAKTHQNFGADDQLCYFFFLCHFVCFVDKSDRMSTGKQRFSTSQCLLKAAEYRRTPNHFVRNPCQPGDSCFKMKLPENV